MLVKMVSCLKNYKILDALQCWDTAWKSNDRLLFFSCFWPNLFHWSSFVSIAIYRRLNKFKFTFRTCIWSTQIAYRILLSDSCSNSYYIVMHYWLTVECNTKTRNYSRSIICISLEACSKVKTIFQKRQQVQWQFSCFPSNGARFQVLTLRIMWPNCLR